MISVTDPLERPTVTGDFAEALLLMFVGNLDRGILLVVVEHGVFRDGEDALVLIEREFRRWRSCWP